MKSWKKMTPDERRAWDAHVQATIRHLRELVERGNAQLEARRTDPKPGPP